MEETHDGPDPRQQLQHRTKQFALRVIRLSQALPNDATGWVIGKQILKSGTSVGANYRASCRSRSDKDFLARMGVVEEEADETMYWLELLMESGLMPEDRLMALHQEAETIVKMVARSIITVKERMNDTRVR
jgi:four helix bundle protein